jgi:hypothetical protein
MIKKILKFFGSVFGSGQSRTPATIIDLDTGSPILDPAPIRKTDSAKKYPVANCRKIWRNRHGIH